MQLLPWNLPSESPPLFPGRHRDATPQGLGERLEYPWPWGETGHAGLLWRLEQFVLLCPPFLPRELVQLGLSTAWPREHSSGRLIHLKSRCSAMWFSYKEEQSTNWRKLWVHPRTIERSQTWKVCPAPLCLHKVSRTDEFVEMERRWPGVGWGRNEDRPHNRLDISYRMRDRKVGLPETQAGWAFYVSTGIMNMCIPVCTTSALPH